MYGNQSLCLQSSNELKDNHIALLLKPLLCFPNMNNIVHFVILHPFTLSFHPIPTTFHLLLFSLRPNPPLVFIAVFICAEKPV